MVSFRKILAGLAILGAILVWGISQDQCNDVWPHALHGRIIWEEGRYPRFGDYSFIAGYDVPFDDDWLVSLALYGLLHTFGYYGLVLLKIAGLSVIALFLLFWLKEEKVPLALSMFAPLVFIYISWGRFFPRPDFFNMIFLPVYIYILARYRNREGRILWILPLLQILWIQFHYLACVGIFLILAYLLEELAQNLHRRWKSREKSPVFTHRAKNLALVAILCFLASFLNDSTYHKVFQPLSVLWQMSSANKEVYLAILEFKTIFFFQPWVVVPFLCSFALTTLLMVSQFRKISLCYFVLFVVFSIATMRFARFVGLYGIVVAGILSIYLNQWIQSRKWDIFTRFSFAHRAFYAAGLSVYVLSIVFVASDLFWKSVSSPLQCSPSLSLRTKPVRAVEFLQKNKISGNVYTNYDIGGFVGYTLYPENKIFLHSLSFWYSPEVFTIYKNILKEKKGLEQFCSRYRLEILCFFYQEMGTGSDFVLATSIYGSPEWKLVYLDDTSAIYLRKDGRYNDIPEIDLNSLKLEYPVIASSSGLVFLGDFLMAVRHPSQAWTCYKTALDHNFINSKLYHNLGSILLNSSSKPSLQSLSQAIEFFDKAIEMDKKNDKVYYSRGLAYSMRGDTEKAILDYGTAIQINPRNSDAYLNRGQCYYEKGKLDEAIADYSQSIQIVPASNSYGSRGTAKLEKGDWDGAIGDLSEAIALNPSYEDGYYNRGMAYLQKGAINDAISDYDKVIQLAPRYLDAYVIRAILRHQKGNVSGAMQDCDKAIEIQPEYSIAYSNRATLRKDTGDTDGAIEDYIRSLELPSSNPQSHIQSAIHLGEMGAKAKKAIPALEKRKESPIPSVRQAVQNALQKIGK